MRLYSTQSGVPSSALRVFKRRPLGHLLTGPRNFDYLSSNSGLALALVELGPPPPQARTRRQR